MTYALDTNTRPSANKVISLCGIVLAKILETKLSDLAILQYAPINCLEFWNVAVKPENLSWQTVIEFIQNQPSFNPNWKIALIADSDLENIPAYNRQELPISEIFYLPSNFKLLYASTDAGKENVLNRIISKAHKEADVLLNKLIQSGDMKNLQEVKNKPYTHFRFWYTNSPIPPKPQKPGG